jgi:predicted lipoprotein with Yx(FWY)xxD motif
MPVVACAQQESEETRMNATGVAQRRGFAIIVLLAAVALAAWLIQARLDNPSKAAPSQTGAEVAQEAPAEAAPAEAGAPAETAPEAAPSDSASPGYGADGNAKEAGKEAGAPAAAAPTGFITKSLTGKKIAKMGDIVADSGGWTAYRFDDDQKGNGKSACYGECATAWPPVLVENADDLKLEGIDKDAVSTITRDDGGKQLTINGWPVYRFQADGAAGKWKGQAKQNKWWVVKPDGGRNLTCLPPGAVPPEK